MKNLFILSALSLFLFNSCKKSDETKLNTTIDSLSYAFGVNIASSIKQDKLDTLINYNLLLKGLKDVMTNSNPAMTTEQALNTIQHYFMELQKTEAEKSKKESEKFLAENSQKEGVKVLPSGLQYKVLKEGNGPKPKLNDKVKVKYIGKLPNGKVFDESDDTVTFTINDNIILGWKEGLLLMNVGSKYEFYIPYQLGYGERGYPNLIPPYSALIFEVELLGIENK
jgi:FKBP-type peptidyl-prolyl cis-trans isomerase FklB